MALKCFRIVLLLLVKLFMPTSQKFFQESFEIFRLANFYMLLLIII